MSASPGSVTVRSPLSQAGSEHDSKVCDILRWEQVLCWSRYLAPDAFGAVRDCYKKYSSGSQRAACDPLVDQLRTRVYEARASLKAQAKEAPELKACPR